MAITLHHGTTRPSHYSRSYKWKKGRVESTRPFVQSLTSSLLGRRAPTTARAAAGLLARARLAAGAAFSGCTGTTTSRLRASTLVLVLLVHDISPGFEGTLHCALQLVRRRLAPPITGVRRRRAGHVDRSSSSAQTPRHHQDARPLALLPVVRPTTGWLPKSRTSTRPRTPAARSGEPLRTQAIVAFLRQTPLG